LVLRYSQDEPLLPQTQNIEFSTNENAASLNTGFIFPDPSDRFSQQRSIIILAVSFK